jgi:hypothetical protein
MKRALWLLLAWLPVAAPASGPAPLPAALELRYALRYGGLTVGHVTKTLQRQPDGSYLHRSHSQPEGMARWFTTVEWHEEGQFELADGRVRPLRFLEYRVGADKTHRHEAVFDWKSRTIRYVGWPTSPLPADTQDQGSLLYAFMLNPPPPGSRQDVHLSTGKKLRRYRYAQTGSETLKTVLGELKTSIIERLPLDPDKDTERFRVWLAVDRGHLPVRIRTEKRGQETTLELEAATPSP